MSVLLFVILSIIVYYVVLKKSRHDNNEYFTAPAGKTMKRKNHRIIGVSRYDWRGSDEPRCAAR
jgi:hypothetical protein